MCQTAWPKYQEELTIDNQVKIAVQVNGKLRGTIDVLIDSADDIVKEKAMCQVMHFVENKSLQRVIIVKNKIINIVVS
jgi:leucyl-tRNA synthetase